MYAAALVLTLTADCCEKTTEGVAKQKITITRRALRIIFLLGEKDHIAGRD